MGGRIEAIINREKGQVFDQNYVDYVYPNGIIVSAQARRQANTVTRIAERIVGSKGYSLTQGFADYGVINDWKNNTVYDYRGVSEPNPYERLHAELFASIKDGKVI